MMNIRFEKYFIPFELKFSLFIFITLFFINQYSHAQSFERHETILAYINKFPNHVTWKNEQQFEDFHFLVISDDQLLISYFKKIYKSLKIKDKPIKLTISSNSDIDFSDVRAIFISNDKKDLYLTVFDKIEGKQILLISDSYSDPRFVMINIFDSKANKLVFEVNKANITNQNLEIDDEILLLGGNLIDVAELYRKSQQSLRSIEKTLKKYDLLLDSLNSQIKLVQNEIEKQKQEIFEQSFLIKNQKFELENQVIEIDKQKQFVHEQKTILKTQQDSINKQSILLSTKQNQLNFQKDEIQKGLEVLKTQQFELQRMDSEIQVKTEILGQQDITISRQRQILGLFIIVIVLVIVLTIIIFRANNTNRKKNSILNFQKNEIEKMNEELKSTNEELFQKNEEISVTLERLKETQNQLIQSEKMASLGVLTAGIAHEINNPINFVYTGVNSLKKDFNDISYILEEINYLNPESENQKEFISKIEKLKEKYSFSEAYNAIRKTLEHIELGAERTAEIIRGLSNFSRIEKEEWRLSNIHSHIDEILILLKNKYKQHIEIFKEFSTVLPEIECYPGKISQGLLNILSNAIDAIKEKGQIVIKTELKDNFIYISIKDNGIGMDENTRCWKGSWIRIINYVWNNS